MVVDGTISNQVAVVSGVPQGSVLGPLFFSIYINGITEVYISLQSRLVLYCDNVLYRRISQSQDDLTSVQSDLLKLTKWSDEQLLQLNRGKCKYMIVSKKHRSMLNTGVSLCLGDTALEEVECYRYLRVLVKNNLI